MTDGCVRRTDFVVARIERGEDVQVVLHVLLREVLKQRLHGFLVDRLRREDEGPLRPAATAKFGVFGDIEEATAGLWRERVMVD